jgi:major vault protein
VSLGGNDSPVLFDEDTKKFRRCSLEEAIQLFMTAPEGWYIVLKNPADNMKTAEAGKTVNIPKLQVGHKVNIPGPISFPLWPGQMAKVIPGHHLRYNQYLTCRVYDADAAREHLGKAVIQTQTEPPTPDDGDDLVKRTDEPIINPMPRPEAPKPKAEFEGLIDSEALTVGKQLIIKGTKVSFFIPPTGIEVVLDEEGEHVRNAVTLERLEYCILLDENGNKRYVKGPDVVFPEPTEQFLRRERMAKGDQGHGSFTRKFRAIELNDQMGIYIKVIADYEDETGEHKAGDELFLTGKDVKIYYPREEHAIMRYGGGQEVNYAVAIPAGEGRYLMIKATSDIQTVKGPKMLLPDPREEVIVRRILTDRQCQLMYPGNAEALAWNQALRAQLATQGDGDGMEQVLKATQYSQSTISNAPEMAAFMAAAFPTGQLPPDAYGVAVETAKSPGGEYPEMTTGRAFAPDPRKKRRKERKVTLSATADDLERKPKFTPPRQLTLNTKFQGAVMVSIWTGYAVQVASKSGEREVVEGPRTILLDYDQDLEVLKFSTGTPKSAARMQESVFLRVQSNRVSDRIEVETRDMVKVSIECAYRINFEAAPEKWFGVEDYVGFATDHLRSMLRGAVKQMTVEEFYARPIEVIRDTILGVASDRDDAPTGRPGRMFDENGMRVYDVEVLNVTILDNEIASLLKKSQHESVKLMLQGIREERQLEADKRSETVKQETTKARQGTWDLEHNVNVSQLHAKAEFGLLMLKQEVEQKIAKLEGDKANQELMDGIHDSRLAREKSTELQQLEFAQRQLDMTLKELEAGTDAWTAKAKAIQPELIAALQSIGDKHLLERMADSMAPMAILGGKSIQEVLKGLVRGTKLDALLPEKDNGQKRLAVEDVGR